MAFLQQEPTTFISVKLTNKGRKALALGKLNFHRAVVSDREINYAFNRRYPDTTYFNDLNPPEDDFYNFCSNKIMEPKDKHPDLPLKNLDGTLPYELTSKTFVTKQIVTATTESTGFWSATTTGETTINDYILHPDRWINSGTSLSSTFTGTLSLTRDSGSQVQKGNIVMVKFHAPAGSPPPQENPTPFVSQFYRVTFASSGATSFRVDRNLPHYSSTGSQVIEWFEYPYPGVETYYGSAATQNCPVWNLNIVRTSREIGLTSISDTGHSYGSFASQEYAGAKKYFGFGNDVRQVGFIHYTNQFTGNTYAEHLVPGTTEVDMPHILWHRKESDPGLADESGERFTDLGSNVYYDQAAKTNYTLLKDGSSTDAVVVGRIYYKFKLIVITDPELLTAMSYKANRNWTLPPLILGSQSTPKSPLTLDNATGLIKDDCNYYVTYLPRMYFRYVATTTYSLGQKIAMHCGYIQKLEGQADENGNPQFLTCSFPTRAFPYLRNQAGFTEFSGTGWSCNDVQILVQEVKKEEDTGIDALHPGKWSGASQTFPINGAPINSNGNGAYSGETSHTTIDPAYLQSHQFIISLEDIQTGQTQPNFATGSTSNIYGLSNDFLSSLTDLTYGYEDFFFGNIKTTIGASVFKTVFTIETKDSELNGSEKEDFDGSLDENVYFTEFGIISEQGELVAVGKPTYPIKKNSARHLTFQLEIDF